MNQYRTSQGFGQLHMMFGNGYVREQRADRTLHMLQPEDFVLDFAQLLQSLRAALSLR